METKCKVFYAIHQVLLLQQGPVLDFTLSYMFANHTCFEIDQIILHLSRNHTFKKLTLCFAEDANPYKLPLSFFLLHHLTDLYLESCAIDRETIFNGFVALQTLVAYCSFGQCLKSFDLNVVPQLLPTSLIHLKYFCFQEMSLVRCYRLTFLLVLLKCSPNLEKIKLEIDTGDAMDVELEEFSHNILEEYSDVWCEHLNELKFDGFTNLKHELDLLNVLLRAPRALPVRILVENPYRSRKKKC